MISNSKGFRIEGGETERETCIQALKMAKSPKKERFGIVVALYNCLDLGPDPSLYDLIF